MRRQAIERLNRHHHVVEAKDFTQAWFRRRNGLDPKSGLCAGLVQLWWASVCKGEDGIELLRTASSALVKEIVNRQLRSFYFRKTPNERDLDDDGVFWLKAKYGMTDLREIRSLCRKYGAQELLELDLILEHQSRIIDRKAFFRLSPDLLDAFTVPDRGLRLLLLRYVHAGCRGGQSGHRLALAVGSDGRCKFFDPNRGEITFRNLFHFRTWFAEFWQLCEYKSLIERPVADIPPLRLYRFGCAS
jgi:hypothetical protein